MNVRSCIAIFFLILDKIPLKKLTLSKLGLKLLNKKIVNYEFSLGNR